MGISATIYAQFKQPHGLLGAVAGWVMANRASNRERNRWTVGLLDVQPRDRVLEIGYGPGLAIGEVARRATQGLVVGTDHSAAMLRQARRRNRAAILAGRAELRLGGLDLLPNLGGRFDKVLAVNVVQFWPDRQAALRSIRGVMALGGRLAITYQPRHVGATADDALSMAEEIREAMAGVGFTPGETVTLPLRPVPAVCVLATPA